MRIFSKPRRHARPNPFICPAFSGTVFGYNISPKGYATFLPISTPFEINSIVDRRKEVCRKLATSDKVEHVRVNDYHHKITVRFTADSPILCAINQYISKCSIDKKNTIPVIPAPFAKWKDKKQQASFVRGYSDVKTRISPADRVPRGYLRVAIIFRPKASKFAEDFKKLLVKKLGIPHVDLLHGEARGRETLMRVDPVDIALSKKFSFSSIYWKKLMIEEFAKYNRSNHPNRYHQQKGTKDES